MTHFRLTVVPFNAGGLESQLDEGPKVKKTNIKYGAPPPTHHRKKEAKQINVAFLAA